MFFNAERFTRSRGQTQAHDEKAVMERHQGGVADIFNGVAGFVADSGILLYPDAGHYSRVQGF